MSLELKALKLAIEKLEEYVDELESKSILERKKPSIPEKKEELPVEELKEEKAETTDEKSEKDEDEEIERLVMQKHAEKFGE